jgi:hypothetical protein
LHVKATVAGVGEVGVDIGLKVVDRSFTAAGFDDNDFNGVVGDGISVTVGRLHHELLPTVGLQLGPTLLDDMGISYIGGVTLVKVVVAIDVEGLEDKVDEFLGRLAQDLAVVGSGHGNERDIEQLAPVRPLQAELAEVQGDLASVEGNRRPSHDAVASPLVTAKENFRQFAIVVGSI